MSTLTLKHYEHITKDLVPLVVEAQRSLVSGMPPYEELPKGEKQFSQKAVVAYHEDITSRDLPLLGIFQDTRRRSCLCETGISSYGLLYPDVKWIG